jgi:hypothetical protein
VAVVTGVITAGLLVWLCVAQWEQANRVATIASAVGAVAAAGIAIWAVLRTTPPASVPPGSAGGGIRVRRSGPARAGQGGTAISGVRLAGTVPQGGVEVDRSGPARADGDGDGDAVTGADVGGS